MLSHFFRRRMLWWPTLWGWAVLVGLLVGIPLLWWFQAETFLGSSIPVAPDVLVVDGWIQSPGIRAAKAEFLRGGYRYVVATGGFSGENWNAHRWHYAREAERLLIRLGVPREQVFAAVPEDRDSHRTFESAAAVWRTLSAHGIQPKTVTVFTRDVHARRSRLVYAKVFAGSSINIGVVAWKPDNADSGPWWRSSQRATDLIKETVGYLFELLLNSGRDSNSPELPAH